MLFKKTGFVMLIIISHCLAIVIAYVIDRLLGDPPNWPHPVKGFGRMIAFFDQLWNKGDHRRLKGFLMVFILSIIVLCLSIGIVYVTYSINIIFGIFVEGILIATTIAQRGLKEAAIHVAGPLESGNLVEARKNVAKIVGRDTDNLNEQGVLRATIETVAENVSDGITVPLFYAFIGGAPFALFYRFINTCDSMVGYKDERYEAFGYSSAKIDDLLNMIPARLTAIIMLLVDRPLYFSYGDAWQKIRRDAKKHLSPNSGWGEATVAVLLGIQLGGTNYYRGLKSVRATMGEPIETLRINHIYETLRLMNRTVIAFLSLLMIGGVFIVIAFTWFKSAIYL